MSWGLKLLTSFPVIGAGATYSLVVVSQNKGQVITPLQEVLSHPPVTKTESSKSIPVSQLMQKIIEEKKYEGCAEITNNSRWRSSLWFVCAEKESSHKPSLYNYDRNRRDKNAVLVQVLLISSPKNSKRDITLADGNTEPLKLIVPWIHKLKGQSLNPEKNCNLTKTSKNDGQNSYTLTCHNTEIQSGIQLENKSKQ